MSTFVSTTRVTSIAELEERIAPARARLTAHPLYGSIRNLEGLRTFMASHVFAVWDFMSLLKALQNALTCTAVPWLPSAFPASRRFINEIVLGEESDLYDGQAISHFELYLDAMRECGADTLPMESLLASLRGGEAFSAARIVASAPAVAFVVATFGVINSGSLAAMAAAFTFGREDVIPDIFRELVRDTSRQMPGQFDKFLWYLERHIEVDGEDHGPLSLRMVADLCGTDERAWEQAADAAERAIEARIALWDGILHKINRAA